MLSFLDNLKRKISHIDFDLSSVFYFFFSNSFQQLLTGLLTIKYIPLYSFSNSDIMALKKSMIELHRVGVEEYKEKKKLPVTVVLDNVRSEMNVGSIFRTADAFLIDRVCLCGITPQPPKAEIHKTALGAEESVEWKYYSTTLDAVSELKREGYVICSIEQVHDSVSLHSFNVHPGQKTAIVFGNEVKGIDQQTVDVSDMCIEIPQEGTKHSLNISCCAAIVMWHLYQLYIYKE